MSFTDIKNAKVRFLHNNISLHQWIFQKFIRNMTISKIHIEFEMGSYASILTGVMTPTAKFWYPLNNVSIICSLALVLLV